METNDLEKLPVENTAGEDNLAPVIEEEQAAADEKDAEIRFLKSELENSSERILKLSEKLSETEIKLALLMSGVSKERLSEALPLAAGLCRAGKTPEEAANEIISAYPHLKAVQREIPQFSAGSSGADDGFSAIRKIFSGK